MLSDNDMQEHPAIDVSYRVRVDDTHDPRGPDGQGWNRLSIIGLGSFERCTLRPATRQGALDTLRGMARFGNPLAYKPCTSSGPCSGCTVATKEREPWSNGWHIREDPNGGGVWLLGDVEKGFAGFGYHYRGWDKLLSEIDVPMLARRRDQSGVYWVGSGDD